MSRPTSSSLPLVCFLALPVVLLVAIVIYTMVVTAFGVSAMSDKEPWSLAENLPKSVVIRNSFQDVSVDAFYLVKAEFSSEDEIIKICNKFDLQLHPNDIPLKTFAEIWDRRTNIPWFPLDQTTRKYYFWPEKPNGEMKENAKGKYEGVLWIDDKKRELIMQIATM